MNWRIFGTLFFAIGTSMLGQGLVVPLLPAYAHEMGATGFFVGFVFGAFSLSRTVCIPLFGRLSDRRGRKPFITAGLFAYFLASVAFLFAGSVAALILTRFFQGIASAMIIPVAQAYAGELSPKSREGSIMGLLNVSVYAGLSAGPLAGGLIHDTYGIQAAFACMGVVSLLGCGLSQVLLPPRREEQLLSRTGDSVGFDILARSGSVLGLFLFRFAYSICIGALWTFVPLIADTRFGLSSAATGLMITLSVLISGILMTPMGLLADRTSKRFLLAAGGFTAASGMLVLARGEATWELYAASTLLGIGGGVAAPALMAMTVVIGRVEASMGSIMAILTVGHSLGMMIGPVAAGALMDVLDSRVAFVSVSSVLFAVTVLTIPLTAGYAELEREASS